MAGFENESFTGEPPYSCHVHHSKHASTDVTVRVKTPQKSSARYYGTKDTTEYAQYDSNWFDPESLFDGITRTFALFLTRVFSRTWCMILSFLVHPSSVALFLAVVYWTCYALVLDPFPYTIQPLCRFPMLSRICPSSWGGSPVSAELPDIFTVAGQMTGHLMVESVEGWRIQNDLVQVQGDIEDLASLVNESDLVSRDSLVFTLHGFIADLRKTSNALYKLNARIQYAIDGSVGLFVT